MKNVIAEHSKHAANYFPMKVAAFYAHAISVISVMRATCAISSSLIRLSLCLFKGIKYEPVHRYSCCLLCFVLLLKWIFKKLVDEAWTGLIWLSIWTGGGLL
jgi:hypothetical protein